MELGIQKAATKSIFAPAILKCSATGTRKPHAGQCLAQTNSPGRRKPGDRCAEIHHIDIPAKNGDTLNTHRRDEERVRGLGLRSLTAAMSSGATSFWARGWGTSLASITNITTAQAERDRLEDLRCHDTLTGFPQEQGHFATLEIEHIEQNLASGRFALSWI